MLIFGRRHQHDNRKAALNNLPAPSSSALISQIPYPVAPSEKNRRQRSIVLLGPHDRFNFGDLLFSKVLSRLLEQRAGYDASRILFGGLVPVNMTGYGGPNQIFSMKQIQHMSQTDHLYGPYDIVYGWRGIGVLSCLWGRYAPNS